MNALIQIGDTVVLHEINVTTEEELQNSISSLHKDGCVEIVLDDKKAKLLQMALDEVLIYKREKLQPIPNDNGKCVGCDEKLDPIRRLIHFDLCDKCEQVQARMKLSRPDEFVDLTGYVVV